MALRDPAADVQAFLAGKVLSGVTLATSGSGLNLFRGPLRPHTSTPSPAVFVLNLGGPPPSPLLGGTRQAIIESLVAVFIRGPAGAWDQGEALALAVLGELQLRVTAGYIDWQVREAHPVPLEVEDAGQHPLWQLTVRCRYQASP